ncbi:MAG: hypothetical protein AAGA77_13200 [Bacteroidota bacterium]
MDDLKAYKRILIVGCPGSGKSTLSRKINRALNYPLYSMDDLYWKENWQRTPDPEFIKILSSIVARENWIIEGNYSRFFDIRLQRADMVLFIESSTIVCLFRVIKRALLRKFVDPSSLPINVRKGKKAARFRFDPKFYRLILNFNKKTKQLMLDSISKSDCQCIKIR